MGAHSLVGKEHAGGLCCVLHLEHNEEFAQVLEAVGHLVAAIRIPCNQRTRLQIETLERQNPCEQGAPHDSGIDTR